MESFKHNPFFARALENIDRSIKKEEYIQWVLEKALPVYERELFCEKALVFKFEKDRNYPPFMKMVYPDPALNGSITYFKKVLKSIPMSAVEQMGISFNKKFPVSWRINEDEFLHILRLKDFGYLILMKKKDKLPTEVLESLDEVNNRLAEACLQAKSTPKAGTLVI